MHCTQCHAAVASHGGLMLTLLLKALGGSPATHYIGASS